MRITHISIIHRTFDSRIFAKQCTALAAAGHEVHLVVGGAPDDEIDGVRLHTIARDGGRPPARRQLARLLRAALWAFRLRPSTFHLHDPHLIPLGLLLKLGGSRVVYDVHENYPAHALTKLAGHPVRAWVKARMWGALEWVAARTMDHFVCTSPAVATRFPSERTVVVRNFPVHTSFARASANGVFRPYAERPNTVLFHGVMSDVRGGWDLLQAIELIPAELECRLRLIGYFRQPDLARRASMTERVECVPWMSFSGVIRELFAARVGVALFHPQPNHMDAIRSNKLFEYMAAGIPVIASDLPSWREVVVGTGCGLVADPRDHTAVAGAIEYLLTHPDEAEAMGERGRAAVRERFNWEGEAVRLLSLYRDLQNGHRSHSDGLPGVARQRSTPPTSERR
jgi:glycosyltransferase involved in cell wall biosynthesis